MMERTIKSYAKSGDWPDTVHVVTVDHTYGPGLEYVIAKCGRRGTGQTAYESSPRCKRCAALTDQEEK
jgi:hypothetical protein